MNRNQKFFLAVLALISVFLTVGIILDWDFSAKKITQISKTSTTKTSTNKITETPKPTPINFNINPEPIEFSAAASKDFLLSLPVEQKYFGNMAAPVIGGHKESFYFGFFLEPGTEIKSIFKGKVSSVKDSDGLSIIMFETEDGSLIANYAILGEIVVKENDILEAGTVLAKAGEGGMSFRMNANFALSLYKKIKENDYQTVGLTKEIFLIN